MRTVCCLALLVILSGCATERVLVFYGNPETGEITGSRWERWPKEKAEPKPKADWQKDIDVLCSAEAMRLHGMPANGRYVSFAEVQKRCLRREYRMHRLEQLTWFWPRQVGGL